MTSKPNDTLILALDWQPNTNHTGFYWALQKGYYSEVGLDVKIQPPSDSYLKEETPARRVVSGNADLCICPTESIISCWTTDSTDEESMTKPRPIAVAAVLQNDNSAIVTPKSTGIDSPKHLDGQIYASYGGRFEMNIIQQIIRNSGGKGQAIEVLPPKLNCFSEMINGNAAATWVFMGWEGVEAELNGHEMNVFKISDYGVPYGYSPLLLAHPRLLEGEGEILRKFLAATARGFKAAALNVEEAVDVLLHTGIMKLIGYNENFDKNFLLKSQSIVGKSYLDGEGNWGTMDPTKNELFIDWLVQNGLITCKRGEPIRKDALPSEKMFTNHYLPKVEAP